MWMWAVKFTPGRFIHGERKPVLVFGKLGRQYSRFECGGKEKYSALFWETKPSHPASSQSKYSPSYLGSCYNQYVLDYKIMPSNTEIQRNNV